MIVRWLAILLVLLVLPLAARGESVLSLYSLQDEPLGRHMSYLQESAGPLGLHDAIRAWRAGRFRASDREVLGFGIGSPPVWVHMRVENPFPLPQRRQLTIGQSWLDHIEVHLVRQDESTGYWFAGDTLPGMPRLDDALGFVFDITLPPGVSDFYIRVTTDDPLVLAVGLHTTAATSKLLRQNYYGYGLLYGYLLALVGYNLMLFAGLRQKTQLRYAVYLLAFIAVNLAYTGRGAAWLWPDMPGFQRYVIYILMVLTAHSGLRFAEAFLDLAERAPKLARALRIVSWTSTLTILALAMADWQTGAAFIAFIAVTLFVFVMIGLGVFMVRRRYIAARYFLAAAVAAMLGITATDLTVLGIIPFHALGFHGSEIGLMLDATLLALALAYFVRIQISEREKAHRLARTDPLTQLLNRRALLELAQPPFQTAVRHNQPMSAILLDLDHFKALNDRHGHAAGDEALVATGLFLQKAARVGDVAARWGGEEFLILLQETDLNSAAIFAERLRSGIEALRIAAVPGLVLNASFGVAERSPGDDLSRLIANADEALYQAKALGRNRVQLFASAAAQTTT